MNPFTDKTIRRSLALPLSGAVLLISAAGAAAQPIGPGDPPIPPNSAPISKLKVTPKIALVNTLPLVLSAKGGGTIVLPGNGDLVKFDGTQSTDADADPLMFDWDLNGDGVYEVLDGDATQSKRYYSTGTFTVKLRVRDGSAQDTDTEQLIVHARPNAKISADLPAPLVGQTVQYDAGASTADPSISAVAWDLDGDGTFETATGTTKTVSTSYATPGPRKVSVKITDAYGVTDTAFVTEHVNQLPTAAFTNGAAVAGQPVSFDGSSSSDEGPLGNYAWDLDGDGTYETDGGTNPLTSKTYPTAGTRTVRLRVTDALGATSIVARAVVVSPAPVPTPTPKPTSPTGNGTGTAAGTGNTGTAGQPLSAKTGPVIKLKTRTFKLSRSGRIAIRLSCPAGASACKGTVKLRTTGKRPKTIVTGRFSLAAGKSKTVSLVLPAAQRRAIRRGSKLSANAIIAVADAAGVGRSTTTGILIGR